MKTEKSKRRFYGYKNHSKKIKWDTDEDGLPKTVTYSIDELLARGVIKEGDDIDTILDAVANELSEDYGFCHCGFEAELVDDGNK